MNNKCLDNKTNFFCTACIDYAKKHLNKGQRNGANYDCNMTDSIERDSEDVQMEPNINYLTDAIDKIIDLLSSSSQTSPVLINDVPIEKVNKLLRLLGKNYVKG